MFRNEALNRKLGRARPPERGSESEAGGALDIFRQRIQQASIENMERQEQAQQRSAERARRYWQAAQDNDDEGA